VKVKKVRKGGKLTPAKRPDMHALRTAVMIQGCWAIDKRSIAAKAIFRWKRQLVLALGGEAEISPQRMCLVDLAVRTRLFVEALDAYLLGEQSLLNAKAKSVIPVLMQRQTLADSLTKILKTLGLNRQHGKILSLKEYWNTPITEASSDESEDTEAAHDSGHDAGQEPVREDVQEKSART
jgi:hypothetical protein